ncbi:hypothetical protein OOT46_17350 [Aquabacterium sp. A7-Y]|uniref:hypothetical protein n=1 Tax=Aquabacterium sp. A7-Y TaxID=1349605 RepID=UPI00223D2921|nr:hypothetical protein [Aquabacterium sp. A7-Y]MCW7539613.1 hypothetical protein [Aquabacterium sp. A7-Y]
MSPAPRPWSLRPALAAAFLAIAGWTAQAVAAGPAGGSQAIYQQRLPDGSILLTDRPGPGGVIQRSWALPAEDPASAAARRAAGRSEAAETQERLQRSIELRQRLDAELELERLRRDQALAVLSAERERAERERAERERSAELDRPAVVVVPGWQHRHPPHRPPRTQRPWHPPQDEETQRPPEPRVPLRR